MTDFKDRISGLSQKRLALLAVELKKKLDEAETRALEPIAVIGVGCRFPGGANGPDEFWRTLVDGVDGISEVPADRWDADEFYDPDPKASGKMITRSGGFIDDVDQFDAAFFGITPREATSLDPRYRILLEVSWEALEHAGQAPDSLLGSQTGVFVGACGSDYYQLLFEGRPKTLDAYLVSGVATSMAAGRISYALGLQGPALSVDTACSSSLVAVHLACQSLRTGECNMALASGTSLILVPEVSVGLSSAEMLSPDGRCKTFDAAADGIVRGEGCGTVVLKRLSDAEADGDRILAVIQGTAVNQDGRSGGITAPNGPSQEAVIGEALRRSGIEPAEVDYVEAHGTGTTLGDPIEVRALDAALGAGREKGNPLKIGSVKTNFGHLEASAGIAGLIKVVLALDHERIPPHLHLTELSPHIEWKDMALSVPTEAMSWTRGAKRRISGVSSFGFSGTNAHVIVEEAPAQRRREPADERPAHVLTLSAKSASSLETLVASYAGHLADHPDEDIADVCFTANAKRACLEHRVAVVGSSNDEMLRGLEALRDDAQSEEAFKGTVTSPKPPELAFLFSGQGCPTAADRVQLLKAEPVISEIVEKCGDILEPLLGAGVRTVIGPEAAPTDDARSAQAAAFVWQYALAELWRSWGVVPSAVLGYGVGEYAAACVAGVFSLEDALALSIKRVELASRQAPPHALAAVFASAERVSDQMRSHGSQLRIAAINGPEHTVISGPAAAVDAVCESFESSGVTTRSLSAASTTLSGSPLKEFEQAVGARVRSAPAVAVYSSVSGQLIEPAEIQSPDYWRRQCSEPVDFLAAMNSIVADGHRLFLEVGSTARMGPLARQAIPSDDLAWLPLPAEGQGVFTQLLKGLASLHVRGARVDWTAFDRERGRRVVSLPTYPFEHRRYWVELAPRRIGQAGREAWRDWLYEFEWQTVGHEAADASDLLSPSAISELASEHIESLAELNGIEIYKEFSPRLDALCAGYVLHALDQLGWQPAAGDGPITVDALQEDLGILPEHARLLHRMLEMLAEDGVLKQVGAGEWECVAPPKLPDIEALADELLEQYPEGAAELDLTINCGRPLAGVLSGKTDPMQLLFPDGSLAKTERLYQESAGLRLFNSLTREAVSAACSRIDPDRKLRILELGAGTGAATSYILPVLDPSSTEYVFTDVSNAFLGAAASKFKEYPFVEYRLLDAGTSPLEQGFSEGEFDIVIAANVIHATPDLRHTLENIKQVLAPQGLVVLLEGTVPQRFGDLTVGLTPGWWSFTDTDLRPSYALLTAAQWRDLFIDSGFESVTAVPDGTHPLGGAVNQQSVLVARAPASAESREPETRSGEWLIFCDDAGTGDALADAVSSNGGRSITVRKGGAFVEDGPDSYRIDAGEREHYSRLLKSVLSQDDVSLKGVIHCWAIDENVAGDAGLDDLARAEKRACGSALYLAQALASGPSGDAPRLILLTRDAQAVASGDPCAGFSQASLWGFARVVELEHSELRCVVADVDDEPVSLALVDRVLAPDSRENQVAMRNGRMFALRATTSPSAEIEPSVAVEVVADGSYIVTGGLGGLGLLVAEWLAERGAGHLILVARSAPGDEARASIEKMQRAGASVQVVREDVSSPECVEKLESALAEAALPLRGVVHCAGIIDDGALLQQDWGRFERVMAAKALGTWNLHRLGEGKPLDFFVLFSTGASFLGSPGQSNHAAANALMDAVAHYRRANGLPALTINWGAWSETGAAVRTGVADFAVASGMGTISPKEGMKILEQLMCGDAATQVAVLPAKPARLVETHQTDHPMPVFDELVRIAASEASDESADDVQPQEQSELLAALESASPKARRAMLQREVQHAAQKVMGLGDAEPVDPRRPLIDLGLDSLMAVELRNAVGRLVNQSLPATLLFNYPSVGELVDHLLDDILQLGDAAGSTQKKAASATQDEARDEELEDLGEDELADLLESKLADLDEVS